MNEDDPNTTEEPNTVSRLCRTGTDRSRLTVPEPIPLPSLPYQERTEWSASLTPVEISAFTAAHIAGPTFINCQHGACRCLVTPFLTRSVTLGWY